MIPPVLLLLLQWIHHHNNYYNGSSIIIITMVPPLLLLLQWILHYYYYYYYNGYSIILSVMSFIATITTTVATSLDRQMPTLRCLIKQISFHNSLASCLCGSHQTAVLSFQRLLSETSS